MTRRLTKSRRHIVAWPCGGVHMTFITDDSRQKYTANQIIIYTHTTYFISKRLLAHCYKLGKCVNHSFTQNLLTEDSLLLCASQIIAYLKLSKKNINVLEYSIDSCCLKA